MSQHPPKINIIRWLSDSIIVFLLAPLAYLLFGSLVGAQVDHFNIATTCLFYLFLLLMQFIERLVFLINQPIPRFNMTPLAIMNGLGIVLLLWLSRLTSTYLFFPLFIVLIAANRFFLPYFNQKEAFWPNLILDGFFKTVVYSCIACFIQIRFFPQKIFALMFPLFILQEAIVFYQRTRSEVQDTGSLAGLTTPLKYRSVIFYGLLGLAYVWPLLFLRQQMTHWFFMLLFFSMPLWFIYETLIRQQLSQRRQENFMLFCCYLCQITFALLIH